MGHKRSSIKNVSWFKTPWIRQLCVLAGISLLLLIFYGILYKAYASRANSFGCFDDCANFGAAYFMQHGKQLYSQIFFNHQPLMVYMSFGVLEIFKPTTIFELVIRHKQVLFFASFLSSIAIVRRFGWAGIVFVFFYETTKFYVFGDRFIAESFIVYPLVYLTGLVWYKFHNKKIYPIEYIVTAVLTWFVFFCRAPYVPLAGLEFLLIVGLPNNRFKQISYAVLAILSLGTILIQPFKDYLYSITVVSLTGPASSEVSQTHIFGFGLLKIFFYPLFVFFNGTWSEFRFILIGVSVVFLILTAIELKRKHYQLVFLMVILLALANIRIVEPGVIFYGAFHMIQWFGLFLMFTGLMLTNKHSTKTIIALTTILGITFIVYFFQPNTFLRHKADPQQDFVINYGLSYEVGEVIKVLSQPNHTVFIDHQDELNLVNWQTQRLSGYKYSWYPFVAPSFKPYQDARADMLKNYPPDFLYDTDAAPSSNIYTPTYKNGMDAHLYIKKKIFNQISEEQWKKAAEFGYTKTK